MKQSVETGNLRDPENTLPLKRRRELLDGQDNPEGGYTTKQMEELVAGDQKSMNDLMRSRLSSRLPGEE